MTISTEFECARPPKGKDIISHLKSSGYTVTDESRQTLSIRKTFQEGKLVFNKHKVMLKINLNIFFLSHPIPSSIAFHLPPILPSI